MHLGVGTHFGEKAKMRYCDYQILEYTTSELQPHGVPFIAVVRVHELDSYVLKVLVFRQWKTRVGIAREDDVTEIESFLDDLRFQNVKQPRTATLFDRLGRLNVGPIRALVSGSCFERDLDEVIREFFDETRASPSWQEHFTTLT